MEFPIGTASGLRFDTGTGAPLFWSIKDMAVDIPAGNVVLKADLTVPPNPKGIIAFAHGSGGGRNSPRNRYVAEALNERSFATLIPDLLTEEEELVDAENRRYRFDMPLLASRLTDIAGWLQKDPDLSALNIGWFGASTGAGAALIAAAQLPEKSTAVVSRGGRPDMAGDFLPLVKAPVLLIAGEEDAQALELNREALIQLNPRSTLDIIPRATHLFEEPGTLEAAAQLAADWFEQHKFLRGN